MKPAQVETTQEERTTRRVLRMVAELHTRGYERLRICPEFFPHGDGMDWNCSIVAANDTFARHGARAARGDSADYSSDMRRHYFGWTGVEHLTASELADRFLESFPELAKTGRGCDWRYASWYALLLRLTFPAALPLAAHPVIDTDRWLCAERFASTPALMPLPPAGGVAATESDVSEAACFVGEREVVRFPDRAPATPTSFENARPMPRARTRLLLARWLPTEYFDALCFGFVPSMMEDKWFAYVRDNRVYLHRSWTGYCIYELLFERLPDWMGGGYVAAEALVNRDPQQYESTDDFKDVALLDQLVYNLCRVNASLQPVAG